MPGKKPTEFQLWCENHGGNIFGGLLKTSDDPSTPLLNACVIAERDWEKKREPSPTQLPPDRLAWEVGEALDFYSNEFLYGELRGSSVSEKADTIQGHLREKLGVSIPKESILKILVEQRG